MFQKPLLQKNTLINFRVHIFHKKRKNVQNFLLKILLKGQQIRHQVQTEYQFLKHFPLQTLKFLLKTKYNKIWITGNIPKIWKEDIVITIPKAAILLNIYIMQFYENNHTKYKIVQCITKYINRFLWENNAMLYTSYVISIR